MGTPAPERLHLHHPFQGRTRVPRPRLVVHPALDVPPIDHGVSDGFSQSGQIEYVAERDEGDLRVVAEVECGRGEWGDDGDPFGEDGEVDTIDLNETGGEIPALGMWRLEKRRTHVSHEGVRCGR